MIKSLKNIFFTFLILALSTKKTSATDWQQTILEIFPLENMELLIVNIVKYLIGISGLIAVVYLIFAGFNFITSGGDEEKTKKATRAIFSTIIGIIVIYSAFAIVYTIEKRILQINP